MGVTNWGNLFKLAMTLFKFKFMSFFCHDLGLLRPIILSFLEVHVNMNYFIIVIMILLVRV